jgi:hypothetical protein
LIVIPKNLSIFNQPVGININPNVEKQVKDAIGRKDIQLTIQWSGVLRDLAWRTSQPWAKAGALTDLELHWSSKERPAGNDAAG